MGYCTPGTGPGAGTCPPGNEGDCMTNARGGGTYAGAPDELPSGAQGPPICGSISLGVFGKTQLEVWRMATAEELDAALQI